VVNFEVEVILEIVVRIQEAGIIVLYILLVFFIVHPFSGI